MQPYLTLGLCYLLGTFPSARMLGRLWGVDPAHEGSGNLGATNVLRLAGRLPAFLVFLADLSKGLLSVLLAQRFGLLSPALEIAALAAVIGHIYPPWSRFKGGKGVATTTGIAFLLTPLLALLAFVLFATIYRWRGLVSVASLVALIVLASLAWVLALWAPQQAGGEVATLYSAVALLSIWTHRGNLARLREGAEPSTPL